MREDYSADGEAWKYFTFDQSHSRACNGNGPALTPDDRLKGMVLFHECFHGETGQGLGTSHRTGWTALVARLIEGFCTENRPN